jgi:hypothetical protein
MTLFSQAAATPQSPFHEALGRFFNGEPDTVTIERLAEDPMRR